MYCLCWMVREYEDSVDENKVKWKAGCAMKTKPTTVTMPACLAPCPLRTSYRGALPSLICNLYCRVCEYEDSVGKNIVKMEGWLRYDDNANDNVSVLSPLPTED